MDMPNTQRWIGWKSLLSTLKDLVKQNHSDKVESTRVDDFGIDDECSVKRLSISK